MVMELSDKKSSNESIGVGAEGADVGSNPTPRTRRVIQCRLKGSLYL